MPAYKIFTDSCSDLTPEQCRRMDIICAPLSVTYKGVTYNDFSDPSLLKDFYDGLRGSEIANTAAVNPQGWAKLMTPVLEAGQDILVIAFASVLSTTYQSARIAAQELKDKYPDRKIHVVDSHCATVGQGLLVWYACRKRDAGMDLDSLAAWVEDNKLHICHWITVDDLNHLKRGGRLSSTTAIVGGLLNIKPLLYIDDGGKLVSGPKARGKKSAIDQMAKKIAEQGQGYENDTVCIGHCDCREDADTMAVILKEKYGVKNTVVGYVGAVVGAHIGPGALVLAFMGNKR